MAARATVTRRALDLPAHFAAIVALGFTEVGFAPLRLTSNGEDALRDADWPAYLTALIAVAAAELERAAAGAPIRLTNLAVALEQIFRGFAAPYPCGAGGGYFSVATDGGWYACHRAIDRPEFRLGDNDGLDDARRQDFLPPDTCMHTLRAGPAGHGTCVPEAATRKHRHARIHRAGSSAAGSTTVYVRTAS